MLKETLTQVESDFLLTQTRYRAEVTRMLGKREIGRSVVPVSFLREYDDLHEHTPMQTSNSVFEAIDDLLSIDGDLPATSYPDEGMGNYIQGLISGLKSCLNDPYNPEKQSELVERSGIIESLAYYKSFEILAEAGLTYSHPYNNLRDIKDEREKTSLTRYNDGQIASHEWILGHRKDLGINVQEEIDRNPYHRLRSNSAPEA